MLTQIPSICGRAHVRFSRFDSYHAENAPASAFISSIGENENLRAFVSTISSVAGLFACGISVISSDETIKLYIYIYGGDVCVCVVPR